MYVLSLSNISTTTNFFKITRVELKLTNFVRMTSRYLLPFIHQSHGTVRSFSVSLYNRPAMLFWRNVGRTVAGNIETMSLEMEI